MRQNNNYAINIYYCMSRRAIWGNIQLEGGSIGPTEGRATQNQSIVYVPGWLWLLGKLPNHMRRTRPCNMVKYHTPTDQSDC